MTSCRVREARPEDAVTAVRVLRASITQLCSADHQHDARTLQRWLRNKTTDVFLHWIADPTLVVLVAETDSGVHAVGMLNTNGEIHLCYVEPGFDHDGLGSAVLLNLEKHAKDLGLSELTLQSTYTARGFYERHAYAPFGEPAPAFGVIFSYPYSKKLAIALNVLGPVGGMES